MALPWELFIPLVGLAFGYFKKGMQDKPLIFRSGLLWGAIVALVFTRVGAITGVGAIRAGLDFLQLFLWFLALTALFVVGVYLGDLLEGRRTPRPERP